MSNWCVHIFGATIVTPYSLPDPINLRPSHFTLLLAAITVLTGVLFLDRGIYWYQHWQVPYGLQKSQTVSIKIGGKGLKIPVGYIRPEQRREALKDNGRGLSKLGLSMTWPYLSMPGGHIREDKLKQPLSLIEADLESNPGHETLRAQLDPFYRRLARGGEIRGPAGLNILKLSARLSPNQDQIVYDPLRQNGFIARCQQENTQSRAVCHRALSEGKGLELRYRFDRKLLPEWQSLDRSLLALLQNFRQS